MHAPPLPTNTVEARRVEHTRLRRRILYGHHAGDVRDRIQAAIGNVRQKAWGPIDMTSNPYLHVWSQLSALYRESPEVVPPEGAEVVAAALAECGYWSLAQRIQRDTLGLREMLVHITLDPDGGHPILRPVFPDLVKVEVSALRPNMPVAVTEWIPDPDGDGWIRLVTDPRTETYRAEDTDGNDVSERVLGGIFSGDAYPWRDKLTGQPLLPYIAYHAAQTGYFFDSYTGQEVVEGTLQVSLYYSFYGHILRNAAWAQRVVIGGVPLGLEVTDGKSAEVTTDPASILFLSPPEDYQGQPVVTQWSSPVDPEKVLGSIQSYEQRIVEMALGSADVARTSSDIRSGYSLAVSREAQREAQRAYEPQFRRSDLQLLRLLSRLMGVPSEGWRITYRSLPRDPTELKAEWERMEALIAAGLLDKATAYQELHPGLTRREAEEAVSEIARINRLLAA